MSMLIRRMLLLGTPLLLVPLMVYHQTISPFEQPKDHGGWEGVLVFGGFFLAALWLELRFYRQGAQQAPQQATAYTEPA